ncbi:MAG: phosphatase [Gammaproteobacteria bacterium]|nr:MAG: phosphatase [Gammaproteobacteria bacterium]
MLVDLHTHTTASDGALSPVELIERAEKAAVRHLAITDHDTVSGYQAARAWCSANDCELNLWSGVEYSCQSHGATIHVVGLGMDCEHPAMLAGLSVLAGAREARCEVIAERLAKKGIEGALVGARAHADGAQIGRPHFAKFLVADGHVPDETAAFKHYLGAGKLGDVKAFWPELDQVIEWIVAAGGVAVLAHPLKYRFTASKLKRLLAEFVAAGGQAVEVLSGRQSVQDFDRLLRLAREFKLLVSVGSDFHRDARYSADIGVDVSALAAHGTVWDALSSAYSGGV